MSDRYPGGLITKNPITPTGPSMSGSAPGIWRMSEVAYWIQQGLWPTYQPSDPYFDYVTLLLNGDGTNGAQNNTFLDSSSNAFSITRNGNTTQGSFSPYGSLWSNYFNGSSSLTTSTSSQYSFSGDFTWEAWVNLTVIPTSGGAASIACSRGSNASNSSFQFLIIENGGNKLHGTISIGSSDYGFTSSVLTITANTWNHFAIVRSGTTVTGYFNGTSVGTLTSVSGTTNTPTVNPSIGNRGGSYNDLYLNGYISNFRMCGSAVYTANFTPSTIPLTAVTDTRLLTCQSNRFIDNSSNAFALTLNGSPSVQRFSPFNPTAPYSTAIIGGSGYFDGSTAYLTVPYNTNYCNFGTGDFTIECWVYESSHTNYTGFISSNSAGVRPTGGWMFGYSDSQNLAFMVSNTFYLETALQKLNQWSHVAVTRQSGTLRMYVNGVLTGSTTLTTDLTGDSSQPTAIGHRWTDNTQYLFNGDISDLRILKGTALYTGSTYTVPTTPLTAISGTGLLCNMTNAGIPDLAMMNDLQTVGNAQVSTSVKKFGTGSLYFDGGTTTNLYLPYLPQLGTGDFTIEFWMYLTSTSTNYIRVIFQDTGTYNIYFIFQDSGSGNTFAVWGGATINSGLTKSYFQNSWKYVTLVKKNGTKTLYIDGTSVGSVSDSGNYNATNTYIGGDQYASYPYQGYIDDLRITKGYARYTANFTPPTAALPTY